MSAPPADRSAIRPDLSGRVAVVTGAAAGFGAAFARAFAEAGAAVVLLDLDAAGATAVAAGIVDQGGRAIAIACDVADDGMVARTMAHAADAFGGIDILINNAGLHLMKYAAGFAALTSAETRRLFEVNVLGVVNGTLAARPYMAGRGGGAIVNIASIAAYLSNSPYGVSKLAVRGLTIAFAQELAGDHIRVNAIAPGLIATDAVVAGMPQDIVDRFKTEWQQVRRGGEIDDVVAAALYLCSPAAGFVTGETIRVSGGYPLGI